MATQLGPTFADKLYVMRDDDDVIRLYAIQEEGNDLCIIDFVGWTELQIKTWFLAITADML